MFSHIKRKLKQLAMHSDYVHMLSMGRTPMDVVQEVTNDAAELLFLNILKTHWITNEDHELGIQVGPFKFFYYKRERPIISCFVKSKPVKEKEYGYTILPEPPKSDAIRGVWGTWAHMEN